MNLKSILPAFGKVSSDAVVMTITGDLAIKNNSGDYVRFVNDGIEKQSILPNFKVGKFCYNMPVAFSQVQPGDIVKHQNKFLQVISRNEAGQLQAIDLDTCQIIIVVPTTIAMCPGMSFVTKVICFMKPQGNVENKSLAGINPMMLMMMDGDSEGSDMSDMLPLMFLMGNGGDAANMQQMLPFLMMQDGEGSGKGMKDILKLSMMANAFGAQQQAPAADGTTPAAPASPFGNINPMMLMMMDKDGDSSSMKDIMMMSMFMGGNNPFGGK